MEQDISQNKEADITEPYYNLDPYEKHPDYQEPPYPKYIQVQKMRSVNPMVGTGIGGPEPASGYHAEEIKKAGHAKNCADTALVCGIVCIVMPWVSITCIICGVLGICSALKSYRLADEKMYGNAIAGLICSIIGLVILTLLYI